MTPSIHRYALTARDRALLRADGILTDRPCDTPVETVMREPTADELRAALAQKTTRVTLPDGREVTRIWAGRQLRKAK